MKLEDEDFILCTIHRAENTDNQDVFLRIITALNEISREMRIVMPLHPRTRKVIDRTGQKLYFETIEPVGYFDMIELLKRTKVVMTDSGGLQKEAFFFMKPCITLRNETEWVELTERGLNRLVGSDTVRILDTCREMLSCPHNCSGNLYGSGQASNQIVKLLKDL
jgi:UDP-GlcNAc3NAcA epimerase